MSARTLSECPSCETGRLEKGPQTMERKLFGRTYAATIPGTRCRSCGAVFLPAAQLLRFERAIAADIARNGPVSGESLSWMRRALGLSGETLSSLLHVRSETLSRWETGKREVDRNAWLTTGSLALDAAEGRVLTRERLAAIARPRRSRRVALDLRGVPVDLPEQLPG